LIAELSIVEPPLPALEKSKFFPTAGASVAAGLHLRSQYDRAILTIETNNSTVFHIFIRD
jgi:hypothetical protein